MRNEGREKQKLSFLRLPYLAQSMIMFERILYILHVYRHLSDSNTILNPWSPASDNFLRFLLDRDLIRIEPLSTLPLILISSITLDSRRKNAGGTDLYFSRILNKYLVSLIFIPTVSLNSFEVLENNDSQDSNFSEYCSKPLEEAERTEEGESNGASSVSGERVSLRLVGERVA